MTDEARQNFLNDTLAVMVLYGRALSASESFTSLTLDLRQAGGCLDLFVYDNSPTPGHDPAVACPEWRMHYVHDPANPGVSRAYNEGFRVAQRMEKKWLLLLDQDTGFPPGALGAYAEAVGAHPHVPLLAPLLRAGGRIYSPCAFYGGTGFHLAAVTPGVLKLERRAVLSSGLLVSTELYAAAGGYDERVRLDFADFAFLNRCRRVCRELYVLPLVCSHGFSDLEEAVPDRALRRFAWYCEGGRASVRGPVSALALGLIVLARCVRLVCRHRTLGFARLYLRGFVLGEQRPSGAPE